jgi:hypothetical protein
MDDPWGSVWATTDAPVTKPDLDHASPDPSPPIVEQPPAIGSIGSAIPWGDEEDGFGDWAAAESASAAPPAWEAWEEAKPSAATVDVSSPWATEFDGGTIEDTRRTHVSDVFMPEVPKVDVDRTSITLKEAQNVRSAAADAPESRTELIPTPPDATNDPIVPLSATSKDVATVEAAAPNQGANKPSQEPLKFDTEDVDAHSSSPPSRRYSHASQVSEKSQHASERQDSPITSIDEDARFRPMIGSRKVSAKIQGRVEMYDGLSVPIAEETTQPRKTSEYKTLEATVESSADEVRDNMVHERNCNEAQPAEEDVETEAPPAPTAKQIGKAALAFAVPLSELSKLFTTTASPVVKPTSDQELPDLLSVDSFDTIAERKVWYRITRQGSSRRHNAGDDENYRRVAWQSSYIHADVLKTVRRWMEEDSIAGRAALGGTGGRTNMFGWDSTAEADPVALDKVFGRRRSTAHSPAASLEMQSQQLNPWGSRKASVELQSQAQRPFSMVSPPVADFGWSSPRTSVEQTAPMALPPQPADPVLSAPLEPTAPAQPLMAMQSMAPLHIAPIPAGKDLATGQPMDGAGNDDDDEWGEMIGSPMPDLDPAPGKAAEQSSMDVLQTKEPEASRVYETRLDEPAQDEARVRAIVQALPDLSYMLR